ncbi:MAG: phosphate acyltransferase PlsX [Holosporales bacterium]|nr:phosphate acyltransferase PlsX [Holosporales bacterium]
MSLTIAVDGMGGDHAPEVVVQGLHLALQRLPSLNFLLFGQEAQLSPLLKKFPDLQKKVSLCHTDEVILSETKPSTAVRTLKNSSMRLAIEAVHQGKAQGVVSAGNTGAYMALAKLILKTLPGIDRPAIVSQVPTLKGESLFLDLGGNIECETRHLVEFSLMGEMFARYVFGIPHPKVGLINVGSEAVKGPNLLKEAASILSKLPLDFHGFVEGDDVTRGRVDVVVTDGFTGNVALKTGEGVMRLIFDSLKRGFSSSWRGKLGYFIAKPIFESLKYQLDPRKYNGAFWLGLNGVAVKSHGGTDPLGFAYAVEMTFDILRSGLNEKIIAEIQNPQIQKILHILTSHGRPNTTPHEESLCAISS